MPFSSWIEFINQLDDIEDGVGDIIWDFYFRDNRKEIETNQKRLIGEFKYFIQSVSSNINFGGLKKHKSFITKAIQKKKHSVKIPFPSRFHPEHSKYSTLISKTNAEFINSLDIFVGDLEEKLLVSTLLYKNRFLVKYEYPSRYQYVWKNNPKKNFIIKYLFYSIIQDFWCSHTCSGLTKTGKRCSNWLKDGCLHRCNTHKFK